VLEPEGFIEIRGWKALGNKLPFAKVKDVKLLTPKAVGVSSAVAGSGRETRELAFESEPTTLEAADADVTESIQLGLFS